MSYSCKSFQQAWCWFRDGASRTLFPLASRIETPQLSLPAHCLDPIFQCGGCDLSTGFAPVLLSYAPAKSIFPFLHFDLGTIPSIAAPATFGCPDTAIKTRELYHRHISPANVWRMGCALTAAWLDSQIQKSQTTDMREPLCFMSSRENKVEIAIKKIKRKKKIKPNVVVENCMILLCCFSFCFPMLLLMGWLSCLWFFLMLAV